MAALISSHNFITPNVEPLTFGWLLESQKPDGQDTLQHDEVLKIRQGQRKTRHDMGGDNRTSSLEKAIQAIFVSGWFPGIATG